MSTYVTTQPPRRATSQKRVVFAHEQRGAQALPSPCRLATARARPVDVAENGPSPRAESAPIVEEERNSCWVGIRVSQQAKGALTRQLLRRGGTAHHSRTAGQPGVAALVLAGMLMLALIAQATVSSRLGGYAALGLVIAVVMLGLGSPAWRVGYGGR
jgi:hypothetical protein